MPDGYDRADRALDQVTRLVDRVVSGEATLADLDGALRGLRSSVKDAVGAVERSWETSQTVAEPSGPTASRSGTCLRVLPAPHSSWTG